MKAFSQYIKESKEIPDQLLKDVLQASLIPNSSTFKETVRSKLEKMSSDELRQVLAGVKWKPRGLLFKAWIQAVLKTKFNIKEDIKDDKAELIYLTKVEDLVEKGSEEITKVVAILQNEKESKRASVLAKSFMSLDRRSKDLQLRLKELKTKIRNEVVQKYFEAADEIYTRVIEMTDATITISKKSTRPSEKFDKEGFYAELLTLFPDAAKMLDQLKNKYTEVKEIEVEPTVKAAMKEAITISPAGYALTMFLKRVFKLYLEKFDAKMSLLKKKYHIGE